jgi:hypothetical protein
MKKSLSNKQIVASRSIWCKDVASCEGACYMILGVCYSIAIHCLLRTDNATFLTPNKQKPRHAVGITGFLWCVESSKTDNPFA